MSRADALIEVRDMSVEFDLHEYRTDRLRDWLLSFRSTWQSHRRKFAALRNVDFTLRPGARLAVIGGNGAGKSTLLKAISGIYAPTSGSVATRGRLAGLIEVGTGLDGELTGRENVFLYAALLGRSRNQTLPRVDSILDFAGLQEFADVAFKYYSTGMQLRLAFSIATDTQPDILLLDELFTGGDAEFMEKAREKMRQIIRESAIMILVSHDLELLREYCDTAILAQGGTLSAQMDIDQAIAEYRGR